MIHRTTALLFVLCLLAIFEMVNGATPAAKATTEKTEKTTSGVVTFSALGALVATVIANIF
ncbi:hypothetical protein CRE_28130 [Caenorhabditis remanei]|uniref:Uncharacterized protein n=2 Tax=Caenorhabditis remanei TaxID=31234 RepID=E3LMG4_CAERE|nr:hypothetical protein CRE_28130 [Caenorhabditis remanei]